MRDLAGADIEESIGFLAKQLSSLLLGERHGSSLLGHGLNVDPSRL